MKRTKYRITISVLIITFAFLSQPAYAEIINVPDDFETIQGAIDEAEEGDTVLVQTGEYVENILFNGTNIIVTSTFIFTEDQDDINSTIIDGDQNGTVVTFRHSENEDCQLNGFTITNGLGQFAGGIFCYGASPTLRNLIIRDNSSGLVGGVHLLQSNSRLSNLIIDNNHSRFKGAMECDNSQILVENSLIANHQAEICIIDIKTATMAL